MALFAAKTSSMTDGGESKQKRRRIEAQDTKEAVEQKCQLLQMPHVLLNELVNYVGVDELSTTSSLCRYMNDNESRWRFRVEDGGTTTIRLYFGPTATPRQNADSFAPTLTLLKKHAAGVCRDMHITLVGLVGSNLDTILSLFHIASDHLQRLVLVDYSNFWDLHNCIRPFLKQVTDMCILSRNPENWQKALLFEAPVPLAKLTRFETYDIVQSAKAERRLVPIAERFMSSVVEHFQTLGVRILDEDCVTKLARCKRVTDLTLFAADGLNPELASSLARVINGMEQLERLCIVCQRDAVWNFPLDDIKRSSLRRLEIFFKDHRLDPPEDDPLYQHKSDYDVYCESLSESERKQGEQVLRTGFRNVESKAEVVVLQEMRQAWNAQVDKRIRDYSIQRLDETLFQRIAAFLGAHTDLERLRVHRCKKRTALVLGPLIRATMNVGTRLKVFETNASVSDQTRDTDMTRVVRQWLSNHPNLTESRFSAALLIRFKIPVALDADFFKNMHRFAPRLMSTGTAVTNAVKSAKKPVEAWDFYPVVLGKPIYPTPKNASARHRIPLCLVADAKCSTQLDASHAKAILDRFDAKLVGENALDLDFDMQARPSGDFLAALGYGYFKNLNLARATDMDMAWLPKYFLAASSSPEVFPQVHISTCPGITLSPAHLAIPHPFDLEIAGGKSKMVMDLKLFSGCVVQIARNCSTHQPAVRQQIKCKACPTTLYRDVILKARYPSREIVKLDRDGDHKIESRTFMVYAGFSPNDSVTKKKKTRKDVKLQTVVCRIMTSSAFAKRSVEVKKAMRHVLSIKCSVEVAADGSATVSVFDQVTKFK